jgi:nucleotide-binding universal stress UspA family protein
LPILRAVLVPVDGSNFAEHALPYGLGIARRTGATLHLALVHVPADIVAPTYRLAEVVDVRLADEREREASYLESLAERLSPSGVQIRPALLNGNVAEALSAYVDEQHVDVVAMTTHGRGGLQRAWLGSTTDGMVRQCRAPLLLMRPSDDTREALPTSDRTFRRILVALDGSETAERALGVALQLAITADAPIMLANVIQPRVPSASPYLPHTIQPAQEEIAARERHLRSYLEEVAGRDVLRGREVQTRIIVDYEPALGILDLAEETGSDLVVLGTHGRGGLRRMILGSVADKVIRGTHRTVLVHRGEGRPAGARTFGAGQ